jgi:alpha(1,3/1,4) fucosyltransferase
MTTGKPRLALYLDPPSHHFLGDRLFDINDGRLNGDRLLAPYVSLRESLAARGVPVRTADYLPGPGDGVRKLYASLGILGNYERLAARPDVTLSAFFAVECPLVDPLIYRGLRQAQRYFKRIFTWSDSSSLERFVGGPLRCEKFYWPQSFDAVHEAIWRRRDRRFLVIINANKLARPDPDELYTARLRAVEFFSRTGEIDLYGVGWDGPSLRVTNSRVPHTIRGWQHRLRRQWQRLRPDPLLLAARSVYRGPAASKAETLGRYTFALCFENAKLRGWVTEKIFDCFFAGTVPVYWGAPEITDYVPAECFIDMRRFSDYAELRAYLRSLGPREIDAYRENARAYLASEQYRPFRKESFVKLFERLVAEDGGA